MSGADEVSGTAGEAVSPATEKTATARAVVLLGVPGAGKGTQAKRLAQRYSIPHLSTGDIFRDMANSGSELGARMWADMKQGILVPDDTVCAVVRERLQKPDCRGGYILDGFPRTLTQAEWLVEFLGVGEAATGERAPRALGRSRGSVVVVYLTVGYNDLYRRLLGRRSCPKCGRIYNEFTQPPRQAGLCDLDQATLVQRKDDEAAVIRERLSAYEQQTLPLVEFFRGRGRLLEISGTEPVDRVSERLYAALDGGAAGAGQMGND